MKKEYYDPKLWKLVLKADLEWLFDLADTADKTDCWPKFKELEKKYLVDD